MNEIIVDKTHKENISYIEDVDPHSKLPIESVTLNNMYNFVKDDLSLASYTQISEEEDINIFKEVELGFIGQDLEESNNIIAHLVADIEKSKRYNVAITCNEINYINVLAGALKHAINEIEYLKSQINN